MKIIKATQGYETMVDDEDYPELSKYNWYALKRKKKNGFLVYIKRRRRKCEETIYRSDHIQMHTVLMGYPPKRLTVHHIDENSLNNQKDNLEFATHSKQNHCLDHSNKKRNLNTFSKYVGVSYDKLKKKWRAQIRHEGKNINIGRFQTEKEAALAYNKKAIEIHGKNAKINIIK